MKQKIKISEIVFIVLFVVVILYTSSILLQLANGKTPTFFGYAVLFVETDSMEPEIPAKSLILVKKRDFTKQPPKELEVVCFFYDKYGALFTHRIVEVHDDYVITQGDNAAGNDGEIPIDKLQFTYVKNIKSLSFLARALKTVPGFLCIVLLPCLCVLAVLFYNVFKLSKEKGEQKAKDEEAKRIEEIERKAVEDYISKQNEDKE